MDEKNIPNKEANASNGIKTDDINAGAINYYFPSLAIVGSAYEDLKKDIEQSTDLICRQKKIIDKYKSKVQARAVLESILTPLTDMLNTIETYRDKDPALFKTVFGGFRELDNNLKKNGVDLHYHWRNDDISEHDKEYMTVTDWIDTNDRTLNNKVACTDKIGCSFGGEIIFEEVQAYRYREVGHNIDVIGGNAPVHRGNEGNAKIDGVPRSFRNDTKPDIEVDANGFVRLLTPFRIWRCGQNAGCVHDSTMKPLRVFTLNTHYSISLPPYGECQYQICFGTSTKSMRMCSNVYFGIYYENNKYVLKVKDKLYDGNIVNEVQFELKV